MEENNQKQITIMVVEDEELLLEAIIKKLESEGIKTISFVSGIQAVNYVKEGSVIPDAIWLDYYLKDTSGIDFMQSLKSYEKWKKVPVVVVSNSMSDEKVHNMLALGAKKYILKAEYRLEDIIKLMHKIIQDNHL